MTSGIYLITNKINSHMYVGGSIDIEKRFNEHKRSTGLKSSRVDRAIKKYGADNFTYQIITELPADWSIIGEHEKYWIKFYNTFKDNQHYNLNEGGGGTSGFTHSDETKQKIGNVHKDKIISDETKRKMSIAKNTTGILYVSKHKTKKCNQGFEWRYLYTVNGKQKSITSVDIGKLESKVKAKGLPWEVRK